MSLSHFSLLVTIFTLFSPYPTMAVSSSQSLDRILQNYAYNAFKKPRTGRPYTADPPSNLTGISLTVIRLRSGSFRNRGYKNFNEFDFPPGIIVRPYVERFSLVYQNLGNWSSVFYHLPGHDLVSPVLGLLAYDAGNLTARNLPELDLVSGVDPISVRFGGFGRRRRGVEVKCVVFYLNGTVEMKRLRKDFVCEVFSIGHFSLAVNSSEASPGLAPDGLDRRRQRKKKEWFDEVWEIVLVAVGGVLFLVVMLVLVWWVVRLRKNRRMERLSRREEAGEVLQRRVVGNAQLPVASMIRTKPVLEDEQTP